MRVHELAKEFGMTSQELLEKIQAMKIPAKNHASTLVEAYVDKIRKNLGPEIAERHAAMEAERLLQEAEEAKKAAEAAAKAAAEEAERAATEAAEREAAEAAAYLEEEARRKAEAEEERKRKEAEREEEKLRHEAELKRREEEAAREVEERERYKKMAEQAEVAAQAARSNVVEVAKAAAAAAAPGPGGGKKGKKGKKPGGRENVEQGPRSRNSAAVTPVLDGVLTIEEGSTVSQFADAIGVPSGDVIMKLFLLGHAFTVNQVLSSQMLATLGEQYDLLVDVTQPGEEPVEVFVDDPKDLKERPPVVTVMGHVDHGKTSLLDAIRHTGVTETEAGGITQHIGASVVVKNGKQITFIDTPGHEAFTAMRARGANMTDIVILVVAADDSVMPQTVEALDHARAAKVPIIVAINKIDKDGANPERVRNELSERGVIPEAWGGDTPFVEVSAKQNLGIEDLLEMILLVAEVQELKANPDTTARGVVVEANLDRGRGPIATVLVQRGTLKIGDAVVVGTAHGRVRALIDPKGRHVHAAKPADPVEILGLNSVPEAGDDFKVMPNDRAARAIAEERDLKLRLLAQQNEKQHTSLEDLFDRIREGQAEVPLVVKADTQGSIEALKDSLAKMDQSEVHIPIIHSGVGAITETDVMLADASDAIIIGFNVRPEPKARALAETEKVDMRLYRVIYKVIEDINAARVGMLKPTIEEQDTATVEVRELFRVPKVGVIAGCYVQEGEIHRDDRVRVVREGTIILDGTIHSLHRFKEDVRSVKAGYECGLAIENFQDLKEGDIVESYRKVEVAREE
jgi:translation initiation factor IF-2